jgi:hypothetical protein
MALVLAVLIGWSVVTVVGVLGAAAVCRAGHREDVARGFVPAETTAEIAAETGASTRGAT